MILINTDELRTTLESNTRYMILQHLLSDEEIRQKYPDMKRTMLTEPYSSDKVELIEKDTLKELIVKSNLL